MHEVTPDQALMASIRILYQPIIRLSDLRTDYVEVLSRAAGSDGRLAGPETIVDAMTSAERSMRLTTSIMQRTLAEYEQYHFAELDICVAFNLPLDAMLHPELMTRIALARANSTIATRNIRFELTERHPVHDLDAARDVITTLRGAGYGLALDDITPNMPNLDQLMKMPIRAIKLDRGVITSASKTDRDFVQATIAHARTHQQDIIAEGIETIALRDTMRKFGATHGQGFLFSHPLPPEALQAHLRSEAGA
jgi:EAL domain-containing protein (putative c-di-GMP-specific phosphodiesterase class I)